MMYRKQDKNGDYRFGSNLADFHKDTPDAVGQAVKTRLLLMQGEWFLDSTRGTPYSTQILGAGTLPKYDLAIQEVILNTQGLKSLDEYASSFDPSTRGINVACLITTIYGSSTLNVTL